MFLYAQDEVGFTNNGEGNREKVESETNSFFRDKTEIFDLLPNRDPFKPPLTKKVEIGAKTSLRRAQGGVFTNISGLEDISLGQISIAGVYIGKNRRALVKLAGSDNSIPIKEGMRIGRSRAEVKAILPGGVVIVEKIVNIYDQEEYLETIIPISE